MNKRNWKGALLSILIAEAAGGIGAFLSGDIRADYMAFVQPPLAPPSWLFGVVWPILYALMGIAVYLAWTAEGRLIDRNRALKLYTIQLLVNVLWPVVFFRFDLLWGAAIVIVVLDILVYLTMKAFEKLDENAGLLIWPYLIWILFATYLNVGIAVLN